MTRKNRSITVGNIIIAVSVLALAAAAIGGLPRALTGYHVLQVDTNLSIESVVDGRVSYLLYAPMTDIEQYTTRINISVEFFNSGSTPYNARIEVIATDYNASANFSRMLGGYKYLSPGSRTVFNTRYIPVNSGWQWLHVLVPYGVNSSQKAEAWALIYVKPYYYPWPTEPPNGTDTGGGGGGTGGGSGTGTGTGGGGGMTIIAVPGDEYEIIIPLEPTADTGIPGLEISYPRRISLTPGGSSVVYVIANNTGTMNLRNLIFTGYITGARMDVNPKTVVKLPGKNATVFMITLDAPDDTAPGTYFLDFNIMSNRMNKSGHIDIDIGELNLGEAFDQSIINYQYIANRMEEEIWDLKQIGRNMTLASGYVNEANTLLKQARADYNVNDYDAVRDKLKRVKRLLINAAVEIALARSAGAYIALSPASILIYLLVAAALIAGIALYIHKKRKEQKDAEEAKEKGEISALASSL